MACSFDPMIYANSPIGMFHCPLCNHLVMAGQPHPNFDDDFEAVEEQITIGREKFPIWESHRAPIEVYADGDKFVAELQAGLEGETFLSVGYSCPNYAWLGGFSPEEIKQIADKIEEWWNAENRCKDFDEMLPILYELCKIANNEYNRIELKKD